MFLVWGEILLFGKIIAEKCMKMKEIGPSSAPIGSATVNVRLKYVVEFLKFNWNLLDLIDALQIILEQ